MSVALAWEGLDAVLKLLLASCAMPGVIHYFRSMSALSRGLDAGERTPMQSNLTYEGAQA